MKKIVILPTMLTLANAAFGFMAIVFIADGAFRSGGDTGAPVLLDKLFWAGLCIFFAMVCDALDGMVARLVGGTSRFGGYLDSLADIISFGVAPALMVMMIAQHEFHPFADFPVVPSWPRIVWIITGIYCLCAILRLARYNDEHATEVSGADYFEGMPVPGAAGVLAALTMLYSTEPITRNYIVYVMVCAMPFLGALMVSRMPFPHFVNKVLLSRHSLKYVMAFSIGLLVVLITGIYIYALAAGFFFYTLVVGPISAVRLWRSQRRARRNAPAPPRPQSRIDIGGN